MGWLDKIRRGKEQVQPTILPASFNPLKESIAVDPNDFELKSREHADDRKARHSESLLKLKHDQKKDWYLTIVFSVTIASILGFGLMQCHSVLQSKGSSEELKKAALATMSSILTGTITGMLGYAAGKTKKSE